MIFSIHSELLKRGKKLPEFAKCQLTSIVTHSFKSILSKQFAVGQQHRFACQKFSKVELDAKKKTQI